MNVREILLVRYRKERTYPFLDSRATYLPSPGNVHYVHYVHRAAAIVERGHKRLSVVNFSTRRNSSNEETQG